MTATTAEYATGDQLAYLKRTLTTHQLYAGHFDRLWKILAAAELWHDTHNDPAAVEYDGSPMFRDQAAEIIAWVDRQVAGRRPVGHRHQADANGNCEECGVEMFDANLRRTAAPSSHRGPLPDVPAGHYATPSRTGNNDYDFWRVDRPTTGAYQGRVYVKRVIGGHPDSNVRFPEVRAALTAIAEFGIEKAGTLYGTELGQCRRCNRHLTDEESRLLGIGPECRKR